MNWCKNWIFDWDGTLISSSFAHEQAFIATLKASCPDKLSQFNYSKLAGCKTEDVFEKLGFGNMEIIARLSAMKRKTYVELVSAGEVFPFSDAVKFLTILRDKGAAIYCVTGGSRRNVTPVMDRFGFTGLLSGLITGDDVQRGKPDPEGYFLALRQFGIKADDCLAIEDAESGIAAARGAGISVVGIHNESIRPLVDYWFSGFDELGRQAWLNR